MESLSSGWKVEVDGFGVDLKPARSSVVASEIAVWRDNNAMVSGMKCVCVCVFIF